MEAIHSILNFFTTPRGRPQLADSTEETNYSALNSTDTYLNPTMSTDAYINPTKSTYVYGIPTEPLVTPYDIIIRVNSLAMLATSGWNITIGQNTAKDLSKLSTVGDNRGVIVAILGSYNRGKSFLLNQLCDIRLPHGNLVHTEGLSITAGRNLSENIIFIDTAGTDTAIPRDKLEDKKATEALLREIALHLSSYIIIVVNRLRATDQSYIRQILKHCENMDSNDKNIIIIHNLMDIETIEDMEKIIKEEIEDLFEGKPDTIKLRVANTVSDIKFFYSKQNNVTLRHFIFAKNGFDAAKIWNRQSIDGIMSILQTAQDCRRDLNVIQEMIKFVNTKLPHLFINNRQQDNDSSVNNSEKLQVQMHVKKPHIVLYHRRELEDLKTDPYPLVLSPKLLYDDAGYFIGISSMDNGQWQPVYSLYETADEIVAIVELAGLHRGEFHTEVVEEAIIIAGGRVDLKKSLTNPNTHHEKIPMGSFKLEIPLKCRVDPEKSSVERDEGLSKIICPKKGLVSKTFD